MKRPTLLSKRAVRASDSFRHAIYHTYIDSTNNTELMVGVIPSLFSYDLFTPTPKVIFRLL